MSDIPYYMPSSFPAGLKADTIGEVTAGNGVAIDGLTIKDGGIARFGPVALTAAAESSDTIAVTMAGPAVAAAYRATVVLNATGLPDATKFTLAETGAGTEISATAQASLLFATSAAGAATITVTDVLGASNTNVFLLIEPMSTQAGTQAGGAAHIELTFDAA